MECICKNCVYYEAGRSQCRRWPPVPAGMIGADGAKTSGRWPEVGAEDWCGEFREQRGEHRPFQTEL